MVDENKVRFRLWVLYRMHDMAIYNEGKEERKLWEDNILTVDATDKDFLPFAENDSLWLKATNLFAELFEK